MAGLHVARGVEIPLEEVELRASRSSGPGGQHANVTASRIEAVFDVDASRSLSEDQKRRGGSPPGPRGGGGAQGARGQAREPGAGAPRGRGGRAGGGGGARRGGPPRSP